ncbi:hypothetical protein HOS59_gp45 [Streptomyces phage Rowa]|uniref:Uncharacterized protein n=1 Tax=Streptomyces phage Rowa TaxID=2059883 RepID=A0A2H5BLU9_9CAUD|nr:hypothetical protein HOS59_gp45 [Streptomyces phage Rowa]AUG87309.1 hypothetical protein SEA_ROWA_45 [Streptomyces phage Rowa]
MAKLDPTINDPTPTGVVAERVDVYRIAASELRRAGFHNADPNEVLDLAKFLEFGAEFV